MRSDIARAAASASRQPASTPLLDAEQRHDAVADELVDAPPRRLDRVAGLGKIAIEEEDQIIGQLLFGELGKGSQVAEQDRDVALGTVQIAGPMESVARLRGRRQERRHPKSPCGRS